MAEKVQIEHEGWLNGLGRWGGVALLGLGVVRVGAAIAGKELPPVIDQMQVLGLWAVGIVNVLDIAVSSARTFKANQYPEGWYEIKGRVLMDWENATLWGVSLFSRLILA